jgi:HD-GYP domain-containing protein (c-di-GMP phosphodiesterase class II)
MMISANLNLHTTLTLMLGQVIDLLKVSAADILLLNPHTMLLEYSAGKGFHSRAIEKSHLHLGEGYAGRAALERHTVNAPDLQSIESKYARTKLLAGEDFVAYFGVPLIAKGKVIGVLDIFNRSPLIPYPDWLDFMEALAGQAAIAIENATLFESLEHSNVELSIAYDATIEGWSKALDLRDNETEGHTQRVTEMTIYLAQAKGMSEKEIVNIRRGALLHDIGKMGIPDGILLKPGPLTDMEWMIMRRHPQFAYDMLSPIVYLKQALDIPYSHHEKWDGTGYPRGLIGEAIPLAARLFSVIDVFDALTSDRPYRKAWSAEKTLEHIKSGSGSHFDPKVVKLFFGMMNGKEELHNKNRTT